MPLLVNLRHLEAHNVILKGRIPTEELDLDLRDEMIQVSDELDHDLEVQKVEDGLLVQGRLALTLECQCVRCLKPFRSRLELRPWTRLLPLQGEEAVPVNSDCVDLTPYVREDILLEFPQHPLCEPECPGLPTGSLNQTSSPRGTGRSQAAKTAWDELNKLKF